MALEPEFRQGVIDRFVYVLAGCLDGLYRFVRLSAANVFAFCHDAVSF